MAGHDSQIRHLVGPEVLEALLFYHDSADEFGPRIPLVEGGVYNQPHRQWMMWRLIRAAYSRERKLKLDREKEKARGR